MRRPAHAGPTAAVAVTAAVTVAVLTGCTGTSAEPSERVTSPASATPTATTSEPVLTRSAGGTVRVSIDGDRTTVTLTGAPGEKPRAQYVTEGRYVAPQVVPDGPLEGLSPDGRRLVLESPPPDGRSVFLILSISGGTIRDDLDTIDLPGRFTFDAWSTTGDVLYLVEHRPPAGSGHYVVRAYDLRTQSLRKEPVADKTNIEEQMAGQPVARAATPASDVVATLYVRQGEEAEDHGPFVHLLYVDQGLALCVDLPKGTAVTKGWRLEHDRGAFVVRGASGAQAFRIDPTNGEITS